MITERLMAAGQWNLILDPATPKAIRDLLLFYGHVFVFDTPMRPGLSDASMIATSRWGGVLRVRKTPWDIGGVNMIGWLGDEDGKGPLMDTQLSAAAQPFYVYINNILSAAYWNGGFNPTVTVGTNSGSVAQTATLAYGGIGAGQTPITPRQAIDHLCSVFAKEYRVTKAAVFDSDDVGGGQIYRSNPTAVAMRRDAGREPGGTTGLLVTQLDVSLDAEEYITRQYVKDSTGAITASTFDPGTTFKDLLGNDIRMARLTTSSLTPTAEANALANTLRTASQVLRQAVTLKSSDFDIDRLVMVGDWIWVYDVDSGLFDPTNQLRYRGSNIYPLKLRVLAQTWPVENGMSVWYRDRLGVWTDLTHFVLLENPGVTYEVGAPVRAQLTRDQWDRLHS